MHLGSSTASGPAKFPYRVQAALRADGIAAPIPVLRDCQCVPVRDPLRDGPGSRAGGCPAGVLLSSGASASLQPVESAPARSVLQCLRVWLTEHAI
jgi:hypothetical protein